MSPTPAARRPARRSTPRCSSVAPAHCRTGGSGSRRRSPTRIAFHRWSMSRRSCPAARGTLPHRCEVAPAVRHFCPAARARADRCAQSAAAASRQAATRLRFAAPAAPSTLRMGRTASRVGNAVMVEPLSVTSLPSSTPPLASKPTTLPRCRRHAGNDVGRADFRAHHIAKIAGALDRRIRGDRRHHGRRAHEPCRQDADDVAADQCPSLVDQQRPVGVAVGRDQRVEPVRTDPASEFGGRITADRLGVDRHEHVATGR